MPVNVREKLQAGTHTIGNLKARQSLVRQREIKTIHTFQIARMELKRRGWNKDCSVLKEVNACSLKTFVDFACLNVFAKDEEFAVKRNIVYEILDECVINLTNGKTRSFVKWEQSKRTDYDRVLGLLDMAISECVKSLK